MRTALLENGRLYESLLRPWGLDRPFTARFRDLVVAWEFMGSNGILRPVRKPKRERRIVAGLWQKRNESVAAQHLGRRFPILL
jgi:hypothetical protein